MMQHGLMDPEEFQIRRVACLDRRRAIGATRKTRPEQWSQPGAERTRCGVRVVCFSITTETSQTRLRRTLDVICNQT